MRKEAAAREAELKEEAAAARGEAEAAAQLVHALQPKGEFVLGTLWTKVLLLTYFNSSEIVQQPCLHVLAKV